MNRSYLLTPIIAYKLKEWGYRVAVLVGRSPGPKYGLTVLDLIKGLKRTSIKSSQEIGKSPAVFYLDQKDLSKPLDRWVDIRRQIVKRPFLATLEKFVNPFRAALSLTSAFHAPYSEKMLTIGEHAGFAGVIVLRRGPEGSLSFSSHHETVIDVSQKPPSSYQRQTLMYGPKQANITPRRDVKMEVSLADNIEVVKNYLTRGSTGDAFLDDKIEITMGGLKLALTKLDFASPKEM